MAFGSPPGPVPYTSRAVPTVFVAYPYDISKADYRGAFSEVVEEFGKFEVEFVYADEEITNKHILDKIEGMMRDAEFSLFDITQWNANVTLELGLAIGLTLDYYILFNPTEKADAPADLGGIDRIQYRDYAELKDGLRRLMRQQFGDPDREVKDASPGKDVVQTVDALQGAVPDVVRADPGIQMGGIASAIGVSLDLAQLVVRRLVTDDVLVTRGRRRGMRYYLPEDAPPEDEDVAEAESSEEKAAQGDEGGASGYFGDPDEELPFRKDMRF
jgi:hypothetical protein